MNIIVTKRFPNKSISKKFEILKINKNRRTEAMSIVITVCVFRGRFFDISYKYTTKIKIKIFEIDIFRTMISIFF